MDVRKVNIWKTEEKPNPGNNAFLDTDITELNLGVRSFNCLKRAHCHTIGDVFKCMGEDGQGLQNIRNLGTRSEKEILEKINEYKAQCNFKTPTVEKKKVTIIKPAKKVWDREIEEFHLSDFALTRLKACGVNKVGDLYRTDSEREPGWYAVRELFERIPEYR